MKDYKNILVIKMSALGDIIHALPSLYALRKTYPKARISWLVEPQFAEILPGTPYIDEKIIFYKNDLKKKNIWEKLAYLKQLKKQLQSRNFDLVIDLQGLFKSSLIVFLSGGKEKLTYCEPREGSFLFSKAIYGEHSKGHIIQRYLDVIRYIGYKDDEVVFPLADFSVREENMQKLLDTKGVSDRYAVFFPGAGWTSKEWKPDNYAKLAKELTSKSIDIVLAGGSVDGAKAKSIQEKSLSSKVFDLTGKTAIMDLPALVKKAQFCLGGDTGPLHIAAAVGTPTISMFGPSSADRACPYGDKNIIIKTTAKCSPCFKRKCLKEITCMDLISVQEVLKACEKVVGKCK